MTCIKTGFHAFFEPYREYLYGDAYEVDGVFVFRVCARSFEPSRSVKHFDILGYANWFDKDETSMERNSTMICSLPHVINLGYEGVPI